jgi:hypothetical protein
VRAGAAVPYRHEKSLPRNSAVWPVGDLVALVDHRGARDHEQLVAVVLGLGRVALAQRVLDRERVQTYLAPTCSISSAVGSTSPIQSNSVFAGAAQSGGRSGSTSFPVPVAPCGHDRHGAEWWQSAARLGTQQS